MHTIVKNKAKKNLKVKGCQIWRTGNVEKERKRKREKERMRETEKQRNREIQKYRNTERQKDRKRERERSVTLVWDKVGALILVSSKIIFEQNHF
jgi:hypothetical protein